MKSGSMSESDSRVKSSMAVSAMRALGIPGEAVIPVLKKMLHGCGYSWEQIEDENYRILADAIFECDEERKRVESSNKTCPASSVSAPRDGGSATFRQKRAESTSYSQHDRKRKVPSSSNKPPGDRNSASQLPVVSMHIGELLNRKPVSNAGPLVRLSSAAPGFDAISPNQAYGSRSSSRSLDEYMDDQEVHTNGTGSRKLIMDVDSADAHLLCPTMVAIDDITGGRENVKISLVDESGCQLIPNFVYMSKNWVYQDAYLNFSLARIGDEDCCSSCKGDCLSSSIPCACARVTGGEFAYTQQGLLREEFLESCISIRLKPEEQNYLYCQDCPLERPREGKKAECKGHLLRKFIKECWVKCHCNMQCGNRVVQRGISRNFQVFFIDKRKGWGVRPLEELPKGAFVFEYVGEILTNTELDERNQQRSGERHTYPVNLDADWGSEEILKDEEALCLDATLFGNVARFVNHRCGDSNLLDIPVIVETPDRHYYHVAFFTKWKVNRLEELTWDYGIDFDDHTHPIKAFRCQCGSQFCRDKKRVSIKNLKRRGRTLQMSGTDTTSSNALRPLEDARDQSMS